MPRAYDEAETTFKREYFWAHTAAGVQYCFRENKMHKFWASPAPLSCSPCGGLLLHASYATVQGVHDNSRQVGSADS